MMDELAFDLVELVPCPAVFPVHGAPLRETAYRGDAWLPDDIDRLRTLFAADEAIETIGERLGRTHAAVATRIAELGLRRNSSRRWTEMDDAYLAQHYGAQATSAIAAVLGRSAASIYVRATALGLTEGNAPPYADWELAQIGAGYAQGIPVSQLAVLIGRSVSGVASIASKLGIAHANSPEDWSIAEQQRVLALAEQGHRYRGIAALLMEEGFPERRHNAVGQALRNLGYGRGWGRPWLEEEKDLLRQAYARGDSLRPLRERLGRSHAAIAYQTGALGLQGTHARPNGWRTEPPWTPGEIATLRDGYGKVPTTELARRLSRRKGGVYNKAFALGLVHGWCRPFSADEDRAIRIARDHGISLAGLSAALDRDPAVVSKHAIRMGIPFAARVTRPPRTPRAQRLRPTLQAILVLEGRAPAPAACNPAACAATPRTRRPPRTPTGPERLAIAMPGVPPMLAGLLKATHEARLLRVVADTRRLLLLARST